MKAKTAAFVLGAALLLAAAPLSAAEPEPGPLPDEVKASGTLVLARTPHDGCLVAAPPTLEASIDVVVNTVTGSVTGTIGNGAGSGEDLLVCPDDDSNERYIATISFTGVIEGRIDPQTGTLESPPEGGNVSMTVNGSGERGYYPDMPEWSIVQYGGGFVCGGSNDIVSTCTLGEYKNTILPAQLVGSLTPDGELTLELDWIAPFCVSITTSNGVKEVDRSPQNCPRRGVITWSDITVSNQRPVIDAIEVDPAKPVTTDVITITVSAHDPDNDELTYQWLVDGEHQQTINSPSATYDNPTRGNHTFEVRVIDPAGGYDDIAIDFWVEDPSDDATDGGMADTASTTTEATAGGTAAPTTSSTTTLAPTAAGSTGDGDKPDRSNTAGGAAVLAATLALVGEALRKGQIRGKAGELYERGKKKAARARELEAKVGRATQVITDPTVLLREKVRKETKRVEESSRVKRAKRRFGEAQQKFQKLSTKVAAAEAKVAAAAAKAVKLATDPIGEVEQRARKKLKEAVKKEVARIRARARRRALQSSTSRRYRRLVERLSKRTKGILNAQSTARLIRSIGNPRRFSREVGNNPALVRHVIRRAGLTPLAIEALGGPKSVGRMLRRVARNPGRELRRVGRFLGKPKGWVPEIGRGVRRIGRGLGRLVGIR